METSRFLVRGVTWDEHGAGLALSTTEGSQQRLPLQPGVDLRFMVLTLPSIRHCLGYSRVHSPQQRDLVACPDRSHAEQGFFCGPCFARDDFRHLHDIHRSGIAPPGIQAYVDQQHWLYVATFADGTCKVGTVSHRSKFSRLAEQGAVAARYVAWAQDGRVVRHLEDAVTGHLGLVQAVRSASKFAALANPMPADEVDSINAAAAARVRQMLDAGDGPAGYVTTRGAGESPTAAHTVDEQWPRPAGAGAVCEDRAAVAYPHDPAAGAHGLKLQAVHGSFARAGIDHSDVAFLIDLGRLKGKWVELGRYQSEVPPVQEYLF